MGEVLRVLKEGNLSITDLKFTPEHLGGMINMINSGAISGRIATVQAEQARLHTTVSLQKHVVFGAWFAAIAAGYAMARLSRVDHGYGWAPVMALPIAASTLFGSMGQATSLFTSDLSVQDFFRLH